jgi:hypothetical protein
MRGRHCQKLPHQRGQQMSNLVQTLRDLADCKHSDLSVASDGADEITRLTAEVAEQVKWVSDLADSLIAEEAKTARLTARVAELEGALADPTMVLMPRVPTAQMLWAGEGITDLVLPDTAFENTVENRRSEIRSAYAAMIETWERERAALSRRSPAMIKPETLADLIRTFEQVSDKIGKHAANVAQDANGQLEQTMVVAGYSKEFGELTARILMKLLKELQKEASDGQ